MKWLLVSVFLLPACHIQHKRVLHREGYETSRLRVETTKRVPPDGMMAYGFTQEYIMVFGWLEEEVSDQDCAPNFDLTMHHPSDIAKFTGSWCSVRGQSFTEKRDGENYYATTSICNDGNQVGLLVFQQFHDPGFTEATFTYKGLATGRECVYELILRSDIMVREE